ncbi:MAG TPA: hypothetical protein VG406_04050 [Isosphaeraceae bacterium]|nr:hypothetical protein [Isosphaeraceae bacterium]
MSMTTVPVLVDDESARAYEAASAETKRKIALILGLHLRDLVDPRRMTLSEVMDRMGAKAEQRGLTPEILESILYPLMA